MIIVKKNLQKFHQYFQVENFGIGVIAQWEQSGLCIDTSSLVSFCFPISMAERSKEMWSSEA